MTSNLNSIDLFADRSYRAPANAEIALSGITAKVLSEDGTHPGATKDRLRDWKSCVIALDVPVTGHLRWELELPRMSPALRMERPHRHDLTMCSLELIAIGF